MGKISAFSIQFNPPQAVFFAGRSICGFILVDLKRPMKMRGIRIKLIGKGYVQWKKRGEKMKRYKAESFAANELLFEDVQTVFGDYNVSSSYVHPAGKITYPFSFDLPSHLPSSFESRNGFIRYVLKAKIEKPWSLDTKVKCPVQIQQIIDTNHPKFRQLLSTEAQKEKLAFCFMGGVLDLKASISRTCYCAGDTILINANVRNRTFRNMKRLRATIVQIVTYTAPGGTKTVTNQVAQFKGPIVRRNKIEKWENQPLNIPISTPPTITNSNLITVQYKVVVMVGRSRSKHPLVTELKIVIGTVPYIADFREFVENLELQDHDIGPTLIPPPYPSAPVDGSFVTPPPYSPGHNVISNGHCDEVYRAMSPDSVNYLHTSHI